MMEILNLLEYFDNWKIANRSMSKLKLRAEGKFK